MEKQSFWDRYARRYSHFVRADQEAYAQMLEWIRPAVRDRTVLELATGTGVIAHGIMHEAASIEATDASAGMIDVARSHSHSRKLHFSVQDMRYLPYADGSFEVVIAANVLHLLPEPDKALDEAARVLAPGGLLIVPTFTHAGEGRLARLRLWLMRRAGFPLRWKWSPAEFLQFLRRHGWKVVQHHVLQGTFPLTYAACVRRCADAEHEKPVTEHETA